MLPDPTLPAAYWTPIEALQKWAKNPRKNDRAVPLVARSIQKYGFVASGDAVLDVFAGAGTTLLAAEQTGRAGYGIEIAPRYCAVVLERLAALGLAPVLEGRR